ncbi:hypothetical protein CC85DRAFT_298701 [Cutaneotrichosporon oleaginosum]|uniref:BTB domain-containing protein n=1 Tax=Cutaneotrichosporon oleaginosum TaxID=879819 RepID=A0A0J0XZP3_9TREE|nr:uncharacterized protein CC85DRAFT_298701 [Cutaneotrichosporon oleaginosum]KLT46512.1 hypothetical protein CC85DRAFT_298701 [Cutaneotrichosporon oleaginosum]
MFEAYLPPIDSVDPSSGSSTGTSPRRSSSNSPGISTGISTAIASGRSSPSTPQPKQKKAARAKTQTPSPSKSNVSPTASQALAAPISDDTTWTDGDFQVITSDRVRFRVPSFLLFAASPIFRDAERFAVHTSEEVSFCATLREKQYETAAIFRLFMAIISKSELEVEDKKPGPDLRFPQRARVYRDLYKFLEKWESVTGLRLLGCELRMGVLENGGLHILFAFLVGSLTHDVGLCTAAIARSATASQMSTGDDILMTPSKWPSWFWSTCPPTYLGSLIVAKEETYDSKELLDKFKMHLLRLGGRSVDICFRCE